MRDLLIEKDVPLAPLTTFRIGGNAAYFVRVKSAEELKAARLFATQKAGLPVFVLGGGSNVLIADEGFPGLVIKMELKGKEWREEGGGSVNLRAAAGEIWDDLVAEAVGRGHFGMENLSGIPGSMGGAVVQNIGAYGRELKDSLRSVEVFNLATGEFENLSKEECLFDYRHSLFKTDGGEDRIITAATLHLNENGKPDLSYRDLEMYFRGQPRPTVAAVREAVLEIRRKKFPPLAEVGTAGSFFKNPIISHKKFQELKETYPDMPHYFVDEEKVKIPAAWILDKIGNFRGLRKGPVGTYENQALVIVNWNDATAAETKSFAEEMKNDIGKKIGIELEEEVKTIGDLSTSFFSK